MVKYEKKGKNAVSGPPAEEHEKNIEEEKKAVTFSDEATHQIS
jgi:hypothetical protein